VRGRSSGTVEHVQDLVLGGIGVVLGGDRQRPILEPVGPQPFEEAGEALAARAPDDRAGEGGDPPVAEADEVVDRRAHAAAVVGAHGVGGKRTEEFAFQRDDRPVELAERGEKAGMILS